MDDNIFQWMNSKTISVIGLTKNAGKTTTLNYLLKLADSKFNRIGITSIGRDGENQDIVSGLVKPNIFVKEGTIFATTTELFPVCDVTKKLLFSTDYSTPMGDVYLIECMTGGKIQIAGPSMVNQMLKLKKLFFGLGVECLLIDGAVGRRSLSSASLADGIILCVSANSGSNLDKVVSEVGSTIKLFLLPISTVDDKSLYIKGVITDKRVDEVLIKLRQGKYSRVIFDEPSKILCSPSGFLKITYACNDVCVMNKPKLLAVSVNPTSIYGWNFDPKIFTGRIKELTDVPVIDVLGGL